MQAVCRQQFRSNSAEMTGKRALQESVPSLSARETRCRSVNKSSVHGMCNSSSVHGMYRLGAVPADACSTGTHENKAGLPPNSSRALPGGALTRQKKQRVVTPSRLTRSSRQAGQASHSVDDWCATAAAASHLRSHGVELCPGAQAKDFIMFLPCSAWAGQAMLVGGLLHRPSHQH